MGYALEAKDEFDRLERQSTFPRYDYKKELETGGALNRDHRRILDAGCGSGVVTRFLARHYPAAQVSGCDFSKDRLEPAKEAARDIPNVEFRLEDLSKLSFTSGAFDLIVCRYVLQHVASDDRMAALNELHRCLRPGGTICLIDFDGTLYNVFPQTPFVADAIDKMEKRSPVDLRIGRRLPSMLHAAGFERVDWSIETIEVKGEALEQEKEMLVRKFRNARAYFLNMLGSEAGADRFEKEYMESLEQPGTVLFNNKFIVSGRRPSGSLKLLKRV